MSTELTFPEDTWGPISSKGTSTFKISHQSNKTTLK